MRYFENIQPVCIYLFKLYGIHYTIEIRKNCFLVKWWAGHNNKNWKKLCADFSEAFPDSWFFKCQPKRTTFLVPVYC